MSKVDLKEQGLAGEGLSRKAQFPTGPATILMSVGERRPEQPAALSKATHVERSEGVTGHTP